MDHDRRDIFWQVLTNRRKRRNSWECAQIACEMVTEILPLDSCALSLHLPTGSQGVVAASGPLSLALDELQFVLGEGPAVTAFKTREPVLAKDLASGWSRWPGFSAAVGGHGVEAVLALPVANAKQVPAAVLTGYRRQPISLTAGHLSDALLLSTLAARALLVDRSRVSTDTGWAFEGTLGHYTDVFVAAAEWARQHNLSDEDALALVRAHAFAHDLSTVAVAAALLNDELQLDTPRSD